MRIKRKIIKTIILITIIIIAGFSIYYTIAGTVKILTTGTATLKINTPLNDRWTNGLVGFWSFNGQDMDWSSTAAEALDRSGNSNNGDVTNFGQEAALPGVIGQALDFDGTNDYVSVPDSASLDITGDITVSLWIKINDVAAWDTILVKSSVWSPNDGYGFFFRGVPTTLIFFINHVDYGVAVLDPSPSVGEWHHIVGTYDGSNVRIYSDGVEGTPMSYTDPIGTNNKDLRIGYDAALGGYFDGLIDEVRVYNRALSEDEIREQYKAGAERLVKTNMPQTDRLTGGLIGYWSFDGQDMDWSSTTAEALDRSGQGNNGDAIGPVAGVGKVGQALEFVGQDTDYVDAGEPADFQFTGSFSVSAWFNPTLWNDSVTGNKIIASKYDWCSGCTTGWYFGGNYSSNIDGILFYIYDGAGNSKGIYNKGNIESLKGSWIHAVAVFKSGEYLKIYINNIEVGSNTTSMWASFADADGYNLQIGKRSDHAGAKCFTGKIDEVRIYNRALSANEVSELYYMGAGR